MFWTLLVHHQGVHKLLLYKKLLNSILISYTCERACGILAYRLNIYTADRIVTLDFGVACTSTGGVHGTVNNLSTSHPKKYICNSKNKNYFFKFLWFPHKHFSNFF
jgi:hypothetical protein